MVRLKRYIFNIIIYITRQTYKKNDYRYEQLSISASEVICLVLVLVIVIDVRIICLQYS